MKTVSLFLCFIALAIVSCQSESEPPPQGNPEPQPAQEWTHTIDGPGAEYYEGGPQQGRPPDGQIPSGTRVKLVENAGSYSLIEAESGENGYVSTSVLKAIEK